MVAFKQSNNLRNLLVRAEMSKPNTTIGKSHFGKQYNMFCTVNGKSANVIHILECSVCGLQYVGEYKQPLHKRLNGHRNDLTKKSFLPVSQHIKLSDHSLDDFNSMQILIIEQDCLWSDFQHEHRERFWIKELRVLHLDGINRKQ
jgi:hypothetical protein